MSAAPAPAMASMMVEKAAAWPTSPRTTASNTSTDKRRVPGVMINMIDPRGLDRGDEGVQPARQHGRAHRGQDDLEEGAQPRGPPGRREASSWARSCRARTELPARSPMGSLRMTRLRTTMAQVPVRMSGGWLKARA